MASAQRKPNLGWSPPRSPCPGPLVLMSWGCMDSNAWLTDGSYPWVVCMRRWEWPCTIHSHDRSTDGTRYGTLYLRRRPSTAKCVLLPLLEFHARFMTDLRDCRGRTKPQYSQCKQCEKPTAADSNFCDLVDPKELAPVPRQPPAPARYATLREPCQTARSVCTVCWPYACHARIVRIRVCTQ